MPTRKLTARFVKSVKTASRRLDYGDTEVPGLALRVTSSGKKSWSLRYRHRGRLRRLTIGTAKAISLAAARERARDEIHAASKGADPAARKRGARDAMTFETLAQRFIDDYARPHKRSWRDDARRLRTICIPAWRARAAVDIQAADVRELLRDTARRRGGVTANRVRSLVSKLFRWARQEDYLQTNPAVDMPTRQREASRDRELSPDEIVTFWKRLDDPKIFDPTVALGLKLRLFLGQRGANINGMEWAHLDVQARTWEIPAAAMKGGRPHVVPIPPEVIVLLKKQRRLVGADARYVLEGGRARNVRLGITEKIGLRDVMPKDLRRTCATGMARAGAARFIVARVLGHVDRSITAVYDRYEHLHEKRVALEAWARRLTAIVEGKDTTQILTFTPGAR